MHSPATGNGHPEPCSVAGLRFSVHLRRSVLLPATGNGHSAPCSVAGWLPTVAGPGAKCRRSADFCGPATFRAFTCDGKWALSACSVAGRPIFADLRRSVPSPATGNGHPASCSVAGQQAKGKASQPKQGQQGKPAKAKQSQGKAKAKPSQGKASKASKPSQGKAKAKPKAKQKQSQGKASQSKASQSKAKPSQGKASKASQPKQSKARPKQSQSKAKPTRPVNRPRFGGRC